MPIGETYVDCNFPNVIFLITCNRCSLEHVGEKAQKINERFNWYRTGFNQPSKYSTTIDIIFWELLLLCQIFFSPQVKRSVSISNTHGINELPDELPNDLTLRDLGN